MINIRYNFCANKSSVKLQLVEEDWLTFVKNLSNPAIRVQKDGPSFVPALFVDGGTRRDEDALEHSLVVLDIDNKNNTITTERIKEALDGWVYAAHTTHSSTPDNPKWRVVIPIEDTLSHEVYEKCYWFFQKMFGDEMDGTCLNLSRLFFLPATPDIAFYDYWHTTNKRGAKLFSFDDVPSNIESPKRKAVAKVEKDEDFENTLLDEIPSGNIDNTFVSIAGLLWGFGCTLEDVHAVLESMSKRTEVEVSPSHIRDVLKTVQRYTRGQHKLRIYDYNIKHAIIAINGDTKIMREDIDPTLKSPKLTFFSPGSFIQYYAHQAEDVRNWLSSAMARRYDGLMFDPDSRNPRFYNLWQGFAYIPDNTRGSCRLYLKHIEDNICGGDHELYTWLLAWMASIVQNPGKLDGTAVVLRGEQGTGKSIACTIFGSLFGVHFAQVSRRDDIVGRFTGSLADKVLVLAEEAFFAGDKQVEGRLKALVTETTQTIEYKGMNSFVVKNCTHLMMASNHDWVVPAGPNERRFAVIDVGKGKQQDHEYFLRIIDEMDEDGRSALLHFLLNFDIKASGQDPRVIPNTAALLEHKVMSLPRHIAFWITFLDKAETNKPYLKKDVYEDYQLYAKDSWMMPITFWMSLQKYVKKGEDYIVKRASAKNGAERPEMIIFNNIVTAREKFAKSFDKSTTWKDLRISAALPDEDDVYDVETEHEEKPY